MKALSDVNQSDGSDPGQWAGFSQEAPENWVTGPVGCLHYPVLNTAIPMSLSCCGWIQTVVVNKINVSCAVSGARSQSTAVPVTSVLPTSTITVAGSTTVWGAGTTSESVSAPESNKTCCCCLQLDVIITENRVLCFIHFYLQDSGRDKRLYTYVLLSVSLQRESLWLKHIMTIKSVF